MILKEIKGGLFLRALSALPICTPLMRFFKELFSDPLKKAPQVCKFALKEPFESNLQYVCVFLRLKKRILGDVVRFFMP